MTLIFPEDRTWKKFLSKMRSRKAQPGAVKCGDKNCKVCECGVPFSGACGEITQEELETQALDKERALIREMMWTDDEAQL